MHREVLEPLYLNYPLPLLCPPPARDVLEPLFARRRGVLEPLFAHLRARRLGAPL